jgi:geranylgeranyl diphosphate synthase type II
MTSRILQRLNDNKTLIDGALSSLFHVGDTAYQPLFDAVKYSLNSGGKRIRPHLTLEFCRLFGGDEQTAIRFACGVEMVHTYSLIHDDMPCMDDDDLRRGKPTNHKVFGEATAMLAGDALLTHAFEVVADTDFESPVTAVKTVKTVKAVKLLAGCAGIYGMVGGQQMDLLGENNGFDYAAMEKMERLKTGKMIEAACVMGLYAAGHTASDEILADTTEYARCIGLAFQIKDDILDAVGDTAALGKKIGRDEVKKKTTFLSFMSAAEADQRACELTQQAVKAIGKYTGSDVLIETAEFLIGRNN